MVLAQFRQQYPQGSLVSELVEIDRGTYIVKVSISIEGTILATGLAGAERVETAEDLARERAIAALLLDSHQTQLSPTPNSQSTQPKSVKIAAAFQSPANLVKENGLDVNQITTPSVTAQVLEPPAVAPSPMPIPEPDLAVSQPFAQQSTNSQEESLQTNNNSSNQLETPSETIPETIEESESNHQTSNLFAGTFNPEINLESDYQEAIAPPSSSDNAPNNKQTAVEVSDFDFMEIKQKTDLEIERLGWTKEYGRDFIKKHYGKRTRLHLTNEQLLEFLQYLESQPTPS